MAVIKYQNQSDYAFLQWMGSFPNSGHPGDEERFYRFAKTVAVYRNQKWLDLKFFEKNILGHPTYFEEEKVEKYWRRLRELVAFYKVGPIPTSGLDGSEHGYYQVGVKKGKMYRIAISQAEYLRGGATKKALRDIKD